MKKCYWDYLQAVKLNFEFSMTQNYQKLVN